MAEQLAIGVDTFWGLTAFNGLCEITLRYANGRRILIQQNIKVAMGQNYPDQKTRAIGHSKAFGGCAVS